MKKYKLTIQGNNYDVKIIDIEDNVAEVEVNGTLYKVEVDKKIETSKTPRLIRSVAVPSTESVPFQHKTSAPGALKGIGHIKSPLPGTILIVHVKAGDSVKVGSKLITLEAMKMENPIHSPVDGKVVEIFVDTGDVVQNGDVLLVVQ